MLTVGDKPVFASSRSTRSSPRGLRSDQQTVQNPCIRSLLHGQFYVQLQVDILLTVGCEVNLSITPFEPGTSVKCKNKLFLVFDGLSKKIAISLLLLGEKVAIENGIRAFIRSASSL